jgi:hypothetical protein
MTMMMRYALVASDAPGIAAYLPGNSRILGAVDGQAVITGRDHAGWTLEGYVIPRPGSGLYFTTEIDLSRPALRTAPRLSPPPAARSPAAGATR